MWCANQDNKTGIDWVVRKDFSAEMPFDLTSE